MKFKEEWLFPNAVVPVDAETTQAMVEQIKRMMDTIGGMALDKVAEYERGFIDGMQKQMQSSVDKAVNAMAKRKWKTLSSSTINSLACRNLWNFKGDITDGGQAFARAIEQRLKDKNNG